MKSIEIEELLGRSQLDQVACHMKILEREREGYENWGIGVVGTNKCIEQMGCFFDSGNLRVKIM